ncbi:hypothetical protein [Campylobacter troglodytis]|uniref:hypothetical protein n=1 Tax=Campylobacter troglodytis TaxID=654363 RepID=UPI001158FC21|nr:hypothetical protein [Campylobacter troglodytis]
MFVTLSIAKYLKIQRDISATPQYDNHTFVILNIAKYLKIQRDISVVSLPQYDNVVCHSERSEESQNSKRYFVFYENSI